jgi:hypothetical protein
MDMTIRFVFIIAIFLTQNAFGQGVFNPAGADVWGVGGITTTSTQNFAGMQNPALLALNNDWGVALNADQRYGTKENTTAVFTIYRKWKGFTSSLNILHYGYDLFNQQRLGASFSRKLSEVFALGIGIDYVATNIREYGNTGRVVPSLGVIYQPTKPLHLGFYLFNPALQTYANNIDQIMPAFARLGMKYEFSSKVITQFEIQQTLEQPAIIRGGIRYFPHEKFYLSMGVTSNPAQYTFGTGMKLPHLRIDFAAVIHEVLGFSPQIGLAYPMW